MDRKSATSNAAPFCMAGPDVPESIVHAGTPAYLYNALQHGVEKLALYKNFLKHLRAVEAFLSDKSLRRLYMATCLAEHPEKDKLRNYSTVHIDWRWEMLSKALHRLFSPLPLLEGDLVIVEVAWLGGGQGYHALDQRCRRSA